MQHEPAARVAAGYGVSLPPRGSGKVGMIMEGKTHLQTAVRAQYVVATNYQSLIFVRYTRCGKREKPEMK